MHHIAVAVPRRAFSNDLLSYAGSSNAYTDTEDTVYYFDVDAKSAFGALDRFSEFFKAPLFTAR
jgi:insulysin